MPISHTDSISGSIYIIAPSAERANTHGLAYLRSVGTDNLEDYGVYDDAQSADLDLHNRYKSYGRDEEKVYKFSLDIRIADADDRT